MMPIHILTGVHPYQARVEAAVELFKSLVSLRHFPRFVTTYLYEQSTFQDLVKRGP
jgi:hypothetical protein